MDRKLVSKQKWEPYHITRYGVPLEKVLAAMVLVGRSRKKIYAVLKAAGFKNLPNDLK